jgi:hypothetical protein
MKNTIYGAFVLALVMGLAASGVMAYDIPDTTLVQPWKNGAPTGAAYTDVIGSLDLFDTFGANVSGNTFKIFTNWNPNKDGTPFPEVQTADFFIDANNDGLWDFAIRLDSLSGVGNVYDASSFKNADSIFSGTGHTYGGLFDGAQDTAVRATGLQLGTTSVIWTIGAGGLNNEVDIDLTGIVSGQYRFFWGTATCANDGFNVPAVPVPASLLLLGFGLLRFAGLGIRKRNIV